MKESRISIFDVSKWGTVFFELVDSPFFLVQIQLGWTLHSAILKTKEKNQDQSNALRRKKTKDWRDDTSSLKQNFNNTDFV